MAKGSEQATFAINLGGNAKVAAKDAADAMAQLKEKISGGINSIKDMNASLRNLKGATDEVKSAKDELKAKIKAEQDAISRATLEQLKQKKALEALGKTEKVVDADRAKGTKSVSAAIKAAGGPIADLKSKVESFGEIAGGSNAKLALLTLGTAAAVAAFVALGAAAVGAIASFTKFVISSADAARSARLMREAAMGGNAQWGKNFGEQVDAMARTVPKTRAQLDAMGTALAKNNIGGQTWVDTMNAVAQAASALGDDAGSKIQEFITRGQQFQRFHLNPQELLGTGVNFTEVADALGKSMGVGVDKAKKALFEGRVKLADGAAALRAAIEKKFAAINLRQMLSLDGLAKRFEETMQDLTKDIDLEPLLKSLKEILACSTCRPSPVRRSSRSSPCLERTWSEPSLELRQLQRSSSTGLSLVLRS